MVDTLDSAREDTRPRSRGRALAVGGLILLVAVVAIVAVNSRSGAVDERIRNDAVQGAPRPVEPLLGFDHWITVHQIGTILMMITLVTACIIGWRRKPGNPLVLMVIVTTTLIWQDPFGNWAPYAVYNPQLQHWPETWPLVSLSPTVEPFIVIGYATFYMAPYFPAIWTLRRVQTRRPVGSVVWRHPLLCMAGLILVYGFIFDAFLEMSLIRTQLYIYSQVIPFGSYATGEWYQFPLIWESALVCVIMIPAGVLLYKDDTGKTVAEKLAQKVRFLRSRPTLGTFLVMLVILNVAYFVYVGAFAVIRGSGAATSVACPYPYPEAKVYDPQGLYEKAGQPGPYFEGIWSTWATLQPDGRPNVEPPADGGRCGPHQ
jgi:hypothetical protein